MRSLLVGFGLLAAAGLMADPAPPKEWEPEVFPISYWCGPPAAFTTREQYERIAAAGFTYAMPPCDGAGRETNLKILDLARQTGLKAFLSDSRIPLQLGGDAKRRAQLDAVVGDYARRPAFAGYFLTDEPGAGAFPGLAEVVGYLREKDPRHPAYVNLLPNYASPEQLGTKSYPEHLQRFLDTVRPAILSYDHYHFLKGSDRPGFFENLEAARAASVKSGVPFWQIVLDVPHGPYRALTEAEKRFEAMQTLAYGAGGLMWFTYWTPADPSFRWGPALMNRDGTPTPQYAEVRRINRDVQAMGKALLKARSLAVLQNGKPARASEDPRRDWPFLRAENTTAGIFRDERAHYLLLANRDYRKPTPVEATFTVRDAYPQRLDRKTGKWENASFKGLEVGAKVLKVELAPGDGELYRW